jgi:glycosyltransferase involved in cell wall biosynthesis
MNSLPVSIVIPTRDRPGYLAVTLDSVVPQARAAGGEVIVADDGSDARIAALAADRGARLVRTGGRGANAARNAGIAAATGATIVLTDDDVRAPVGWLDAILTGVERSPGHDVFGGPIRAEIEGGGPRSCGRENAPITTLDLGPADHDTELVWSANMAIRRTALDRVGPFDETIHGRGEEEDWERRYRAQGGHIRYLADAGLAHRRSRRDATLPRLVRAAYALGRTARRYDVVKGQAPPAGRELRVLAGCVVHVVRRRCAAMIPAAAQAAGRIAEMLSERRR